MMMEKELSMNLLIRSQSLISLLRKMIIKMLQLLYMSFLYPTLPMDYMLQGSILIDRVKLLTVILWAVCIYTKECIVFRVKNTKICLWLVIVQDQIEKKFGK